MKKERAGVGMGLNLVLLLAMVATNILSLYHLSSIRGYNSTNAPANALIPTDVPDHLVAQLRTIRDTIAHLSQLRDSPDDSSSSSAAAPPPPPELLLYSRLAPIASACSDHADLLRRYMSYTPFAPCPPDSSAAAEPLVLRGCHPLPRRRCFSPSPPRQPVAGDPLFPSSLPDSAVVWPPGARCRSFSCLPRSLGFDAATESARFVSAASALDLTVFQLVNLARTTGAGPIRVGLDVAGGTGTLAARMRQVANATVVTTTLNLGAPYSEAAAMRGLVALHAPLQQRLPVHDAAVDVVRTGRAVNRWIPGAALEFLLYDADRVLRPGGLLWVDHFFCRSADLEAVYVPMIGRLGYRRIKWAVGNKTDASGLRNGELYLTALLQKPLPKAAAAASS